MQPVMYVVKVVWRDGRVTLSAAHTTHRTAVLWSRAWRRCDAVLETLVIARRVEPIGNGPTRPTAA
jgi:hypothetical protein